MRQCTKKDCWSYSINEDPTRRLCDKCYAYRCGFIDGIKSVAEAYQRSLADLNLYFPDCWATAKKTVDFWRGIADKLKKTLNRKEEDNE